MKYKSIKFGLLFTVAFVCASLAGAPRANASVLYQQGATSNDVTTSVPISTSSTLAVQSLGGGLSGTLKSITLSMNQLTSTGQYGIELRGCSVGNTNSFCDYVYSNNYTTGNTVTVGTDKNVTFVFTNTASFDSVFYGFDVCTGGLSSSGCTLDPTLYYNIELYQLSGGPFELNGSFGDAYVNATGGYLASAIDFPSGYAIDQGVDYAFEIDDSTSFSGWPPPTINNVVMSSPTSGSITGGTTVTLAGTYYWDNSVTYSLGSFAGINVHLTRNDGAFGVYAPMNVFIPETTAMSTTGWSASVALPTGSNWTATAQMYYGSAPTGYTPLYSSDADTFSVVSAPTVVYAPSIAPDVSSHCSTYGYGMNYLCDIGVFLFYPDQSVVNQFGTITLADRAPFSYIYDVPTSISEVLGNTGSMSIAYTMNFMGHSLVIIGPTTFSSLGFLPTARDLLGFLLIFATAMTLYHLLLKSHDKQ